MNELSPNHFRMLSESSIDRKVIQERGYRSVSSKMELRALGFTEKQCRVPALLIPVHTVNGEVGLFQIRPDKPRKGTKGKSVKYETPGGARMVLDVPPRVRPWLGDPSRRLLVTEGLKKADSAASRDLCCIALLGVWNFRGTNDNGGKTALADWESIALNDRKVYIVFDSDVMTKDSVRGALRRLKAFLENRGAKAFVVYLPEGKDGEKVGMDDFFAAGASVDDLIALASDKLKPRSDDSGKPSIFAGDSELTSTVKRAWEAVEAWNDPPKVFQHAGRPSVVSSDDEGRPIIAELAVDGFRLIIDEAAYWYRLDKDGNEKPSRPTLDVIRAALAVPEKPLPILTRIVSAPVFGPDGTLADKPGYDPSSRVFYRPEPGFELPPIPSTPSPGDIAEARRLLMAEVMGDFPFVEQADRANAMSLCLLPFVRGMISGPTPLHLNNKPVAGTGATLLVDVFSIIATGEPSATMTEGRSEDEWRKRITSTLLGAPSMILIDNLRNRLDTASLAAAITATTWEDRLLGVSQNVRVPVTCAWVATGNNPAVSSEIARRVVSIRMNPATDRPWMREPGEFLHPDLRGWVRENRGELVGAALTLVRAWIAAGKPEGQKTLGNFESWAKTMGGILAVAEVEGFLGNLEEFYDRADVEGEQWRNLVGQWHEEFGDQPTGVGELFKLVDEKDIPFDLGRGSEQSRRIKLGNALKSARDRRFGDFRIEDAGTKQHAIQWKLVSVVSLVSVNPPCRGREKSNIENLIVGTGEKHSPDSPHSHSKDVNSGVDGHREVIEI